MSAVRLLVWPLEGSVWCAATGAQGRARVLTSPRGRRLLHAVPPKKAQATTTSLVSQMRDRASSWALKQWREVEQAETGMKLYLKKCGSLG
jgi:hypothetical protein